MTCPQCRGLDRLFDEKTATRELKTYRKKGPSKTTRLLIEALKRVGVDDLTLLDIGGGVGAIQHGLLQAGASRATSVDASAAYSRAARDEAQRQGRLDQVSYHVGNFVDLAPNLQPAHIVTLDRAICCYHDMPAFVALSSEKAKNLYGLVYPRDVWWTKIGVAVVNFVSWLQGNPARFFVHPTQAVETIVGDNGLKRCFSHKTLFWQVVVYCRG